MKIKCLLFGHTFTDWEYIKPIGRYEDKLKRKCIYCGKKEIYVGITTKKNGKYQPI